MQPTHIFYDVWVHHSEWYIGPICVYRNTPHKCHISCIYVYILLAYCRTQQEIRRCQEHHMCHGWVKGWSQGQNERGECLRVCRVVLCMCVSVYVYVCVCVCASQVPLSLRRCTACAPGPTSTLQYALHFIRIICTQGPMRAYTNRAAQGRGAACLALLLCRPAPRPVALRVECRAGRAGPLASSVWRPAARKSTSNLPFQAQTPRAHPRMRHFPAILRSL
jgi:hypothetical protein